jgi:hypothetical protein
MSFQSESQRASRLCHVVNRYDSNSAKEQNYANMNADGGLKSQMPQNYASYRRFLATGCSLRERKDVQRTET